MNEVKVLENQITMTSLEIAELTGKEHRSVLRDIEVQLGELENPLHKFVQSYEANNKQTYKMYRLPKREVLILVSGYSVKLRALIIDRLEYLEKNKGLPTNYIEALECLLVSEKQKEQLKLENNTMKPKADYFDALVDRNLLTNFRDTAKELNISQNDFIQFLIKNKYVYRDNKGVLKPYSAFMDLFQIKEWQQNEKTGTQTLITPKGRETFRLLLEKK